MRGAHQAANVVWAEPVTGSSDMPTLGPNTRDTMATSSRSSHAEVTITARSARPATSLRSGLQDLTSAAVATSISRSVAPIAAPTTGQPTAATISSASGRRSRTSTGKSRRMPSFVPTAASRPDRVWNPISPTDPWSVSSTWAVARVA